MLCERRPAPIHGGALLRKQQAGDSVVALRTAGADAAAAAPRASQDRKLEWIVNGEIYNHKKLKARTASS